MLVYGDHKRLETVEDKVHRLQATLRAVAHQVPGLRRHELLVSALIEAGELVQGLEDAELPGAAMVAVGAMQVLMTIANAVAKSWSSAFEAPLRLPRPEQVDALSRGFSGPICVRQPEGFAFYSLYPEAYLCAAQSARLMSSSLVIGLRSIGTTLGAMVSAGLGTTPPMTLRPAGPPFDREITIDESGASRIRSANSDIAIVDEGPGLSGSSFVSVIQAALDHGVPPTRIHVFPGHAGPPGHQASTRHRALWAECSKHFLPFEDLLLHGAQPAHRLLDWAASILGCNIEEVVDISGGRWRALRQADEMQWPPVNPRQERRKFLARAGGKSWLLKFVGLGRFGEAQAERARLLAADGFTPAFAGFCHGFIVEKWLEDAIPLNLTPDDRPRFIEHLGRYLRARDKKLPALAEDGASMATLWAMALHNGGARVANRREDWGRRLASFERATRRVYTDNRLHRWEWLRQRDASFVKTDAVDHACAHDLIGCQDIAWDIAGATIEFALSKREVEQLCAAVGSAQEPEYRNFLKVCYAAFQIGSCTLAMCESTTENARIVQERERYEAWLDTE